MCYGNSFVLVYSTVLPITHSSQSNNDFLFKTIVERQYDAAARPLICVLYYVIVFANSIYSCIRIEIDTVLVGSFKIIGLLNMFVWTVRIVSSDCYDDDIAMKYLYDYRTQQCVRAAKHSFTFNEWWAFYFAQNLKNAP